MHTRIRALGLALALFAAACGSDDDGDERTAAPDTSTPTESGAAALTALAGEDLDDEALDEALLERAQEEGSVVLYTTIDSELMDPLMAAFEEAHPGIDAEYVRGSSLEMAERVRTEAQARTIADLVAFDVLRVASMREEGGIVGDHGGFGVPDGHPEEHTSGWAATWYHVPNVLMWNTDLVTDPPTDIDDLLDPAHSGCVMSSPYDSFAASLIDDRGVEGAAQWYTDFLANGGVMGESQSSVSAEVASGAVPCGVNPLVSSVEELAAEGAPVAWAAPSSTPTTSMTLFVSEESPHPHAAAVLMRWLLGEESSTIAAESGRIPVIPVDAPAGLPNMAELYDPESEAAGRVHIPSPDEALELYADVSAIVREHVLPNLVESDG